MLRRSTSGWRTESAPSAEKKTIHEVLLKRSWPSIYSAICKVKTLISAALALLRCWQPETSGFFQGLGCWSTRNAVGSGGDSFSAKSLRSEIPLAARPQQTKEAKRSGSTDLKSIHTYTYRIIIWYYMCSYVCMYAHTYIYIPSSCHHFMRTCHAQAPPLLWLRPFSCKTRPAEKKHSPRTSEDPKIV